MTLPFPFDTSPLKLRCVWPYILAKYQRMQDKMGIELQNKGPQLSTDFDPLPAGAFGSRIRRSACGGNRAARLEWPGITGSRSTLSTFSARHEGCDLTRFQFMFLYHFF